MKLTFYHFVLELWSKEKNLKCSINTSLSNKLFLFSEVYLAVYLYISQTDCNQTVINANCGTRLKDGGFHFLQSIPPLP